MTPTIELTFHLEDELHEFLIAELSDRDFEGFVQEDDRLKAYVPAPRWNDAARDEVAAWLAARGLSPHFDEAVLHAQNWNERWEETIRPIRVGPFLIKPTWADAPAPDGESVVLEIDPKMSFGTGYHESTRLALRAVAAWTRPGDRVLDAGTGTGILAIAALKLGAAHAVSFDNDEWAQQNCVENFYLNGVADRADFRAGSIETVPEEGFDLVLANIQRNVLLELLPAFAAKTKPGGRLVMAGLLASDRDAMLAAARAAGFTHADESSEGDWWAYVGVKG